MTKCFFGQDPSEITNELELAGRELVVEASSSKCVRMFHIETPEQ